MTSKLPRLQTIHFDQVESVIATLILISEFCSVYKTVFNIYQKTCQAVISFQRGRQFPMTWFKAGLKVA